MLLIFRVANQLCSVRPHTLAQALTLALLVRRVRLPDSNEDEEEEERPQKFNNQLDL